jgi:uncharacterized membrane protein
MNSSDIAVFALVFLFGLVIGGVVIFLLWRKKEAARAPVSRIPAKNGVDLSFRFGYIAVPVVLAGVTAIALVVFYPSLPDEVYFRFSSEGAPRSSISREGFLAVMTSAQLLMVLAATAIAWLTLRIAQRMLANSPAMMNPLRTIWLMANMIVLPQVIVAFVASDAAFYARTNTHILTPWTFSLIVIGIGTVSLFALFLRSFKNPRSSG